MSRAAHVLSGGLALLGRGALALAVLAVGFGLVGTLSGRHLDLPLLALAAATCGGLAIGHTLAARRVEERATTARRDAVAILGVDLWLVAAVTWWRWPIGKEGLVLLAVALVVVGIGLGLALRLSAPTSGGRG